MTKTLFIALALILALGAVVSCSGEEENKADPPRTTADAGKPIEKPLATLLEEADQVFRNDRYEEAGRMFEGVAGMALEAGDNPTYVEAASMVARCYLERGESADGSEWLARAREKADDSEPRGWSRYLGVRGRFEWKAGDNERATATFREMFDYCDANELYDRAVDAAHMIAITGNPEERFDWAMKGIEMAEQSGHPGWLGPLWNNLGWDYVDAGRYEEALAALQKAREYHYLGTAPIPKIIADYSVAHVLRLMGRLDESRDALRSVMERAQELDRDGNPDAREWVGFSRWELGEIAITNGDASRGLAMLKQALGELEEAGIDKWDEADWEQRKARIAELEGK